MRALAALGLTMLLACGASPMSEAPDLAGLPGDAGAPPPFAGPLTLPVRTALDWSGAAPGSSIESVRFADGRGTVRFEGRDVPAVVYEKIPFGDYTLAAIVGLLPDDLLVAYAYCKGAGVEAFYFETLRYTVTIQQPLSSPGTCAFVDEPSPGEVSFQRPTAPLDYAPPEDRADVDGPRLAVHDGRGTLDLDGRRYELTVFTVVDCSACGGPGWFELHVTVRRDDELAFAILYLAPDKPGVVQLAHGFRLDVPALWPRDEILTATWSLK